MENNFKGNMGQKKCAGCDAKKASLNSMIFAKKFKNCKTGENIQIYPSASNAAKRNRSLKIRAPESDPAGMRRPAQKNSRQKHQYL